MKESQWQECDDPRKMLRFILRHKELRPAMRERFLISCACGRLVWDRIGSEKGRQLQDFKEKTADDLSWMEKYGSSSKEVWTEAESTGDPALRVLLEAAPMPSLQWRPCFGSPA